MEVERQGSPCQVVCYKVRDETGGLLWGTGRRRKIPWREVPM